MKIKRIMAPMEKLIFKENFPQLDYKFDLPILINRKGEVVIGNSQFVHLSHLKETDVVVMEVDYYASDICEELELQIVLENNISRLHNIEKELKEYLSEFQKNIENMNLFENVKDEGIATKENFRKPAEPKFKKKKKEKYIYASLFGDDGEW